jgi:hypothetical protein
MHLYRVAAEVCDHDPDYLVCPVIIADQAKADPGVAIRPRIPNGRQRFPVQEDVEIIDLGIVVDSD